jgi:predicted DCC family thiol-disulfide oxidoreductase YuxK
MINIPENKKLVLFDGICNLCNSAVLTIIKHDKKNVFLFAALDSDTGKKVTQNLNIDVNKIDSIILYEPNVSYEIKSTAALKIAQDFGGIWWLTQLFFVIPESIRNYVYDFIARNRYKWFGKKDQCMLPNTELKAKFI